MEKTTENSVTHSHTHAHPGSIHVHNISDNIRTAFFLNLTFTILEIVGGLWTNSVAILSDAIHDLGDSISLGAAWVFEHYAKKNRDANFSYGYQRFSLIGAFLNAVILLVGAIFILQEAIPRLFHPEPPNALGMIIFAVGGMVFNGAAVFRMRNQHSLNARMVAWHLLEDVLGWAAVLVVSVIMVFVDLPVLDPLLSIGITLYVLINVFQYFWKIVSIFLQAVPPGLDLKVIENRLLEIEQICSAHHTHIWSLDGEQHVLTTHVVVPVDTPRSTVLEIKQQVRQIAEDWQLGHITVEVEFQDEDCLMAGIGCTSAAHVEILRERV